MVWYKTLVTVGSALSIMGILAGCATAGNTSTNNVTNQTNVQNTTVSPPQGRISVHKIPIKGTSPTWLVNDLKLASQVHFPISGHMYTLNWNAPSYANGAKPFNVFAETQSLWIGGYTGSKSQQKYSFWTPVDITNLYDKVKRNASPFQQVTFVYMLQEDPKEGSGYLTPAVCIDLGNGESLAFASNQVITKSDHAGIDQYVVYPVQGIELPNR